jgi:hypothetical protein
MSFREGHNVTTDLIKPQIRGRDIIADYLEKQSEICAEKGHQYATWEPNQENNLGTLKCDCGLVKEDSRMPVKLLLKKLQNKIDRKD